MKSIFSSEQLLFAICAKKGSVEVDVPRLDHLRVILAALLSHVADLNVKLLVMSLELGPRMDNGLLAELDPFFEHLGSTPLASFDFAVDRGAQQAGRAHWLLERVEGFR